MPEAANGGTARRTMREVGSTLSRFGVDVNSKQPGPDPRSCERSLFIRGLARRLNRRANPGSNGSMLAVKEILRGVGHAGFLPGDRTVGGGRQAAYSVHALDIRRAFEDAGALRARGLEQEPGDGSRVHSDTRHACADDLAAAFAFPRRTGVVDADL